MVGEGKLCILGFLLGRIVQRGVYSWSAQDCQRCYLARGTSFAVTGNLLAPQALK